MTHIDDALLADIRSIMNGTLAAVTERIYEGIGIPNTLWHYTRPSAFMLIIEHSTLRASHIRFMNDAMEYQYAIEFAGKVLASLGITNVMSPEYAIKSAFERNLRSGLDLDTSNVVFAASLSASRDDLSQWRAYGGPEGGISIGFDAQRLLGLIHTTYPKHLLLPVEYNVLHQEHLVKRVMVNGINLYVLACQKRGVVIDPDAFAVAYMKQASLLASILKHPTFAAENEWRLLTLLDPPDPQQVQFYARETVIVPAYDFDLKHQLLGMRMPIEEIMVGPGRMAEHSAAAIKALLMKKGYPVSPESRDWQSVSVSTSGVPYRVVL